MAVTSHAQMLDFMEQQAPLTYKSSLGEQRKCEIQIVDRMLYTLMPVIVYQLASQYLSLCQSLCVGPANLKVKTDLCLQQLTDFQSDYTKCIREWRAALLSGDCEVDVFIAQANNCSKFVDLSDEFYRQSRRHYDQAYDPVLMENVLVRFKEIGRIAVRALSLYIMAETKNSFEVLFREGDEDTGPGNDPVTGLMAEFNDFFTNVFKDRLLPDHFTNLTRFLLKEFVDNYIARLIPVKSTWAAEDGERVRKHVKLTKQFFVDWTDNVILVEGLTQRIIDYIESL